MHGHLGLVLRDGNNRRVTVRVISAIGGPGWLSALRPNPQSRRSTECPSAAVLVG
jgi:hypothetical protein